MSIVAGDILDTDRFPVIDVAKGGTVQGEIAALRKLVDTAIPSVPIVSREEGTLIIPGHGRVCDQLDVVEYRDMVTIIRDRIRDLIKQGLTLEQIKATSPTRGYTRRYGSDAGPWTTNDFVEAVYRSLVQKAHETLLVTSRCAPAVVTLIASALFLAWPCAADRTVARRRAAAGRKGFGANRSDRILGRFGDGRLALRMLTPPKGDYQSVPMTPEARKIGDAWDPAADEAAGNQCKAYGAAAIMRVPGGFTLPGRTTTRCGSTPMPARRRESFILVRHQRRRANGPGKAIRRRSGKDPVPGRGGGPAGLNGRIA